MHSYSRADVSSTDFIVHWIHQFHNIKHLLYYKFTTWPEHARGQQSSVHDIAIMEGHATLVCGLIYLQGIKCAFRCKSSCMYKTNIYFAEAKLVKVMTSHVTIIEALFLTLFVLNMYVYVSPSAGEIFIMTSYLTL